MNQNSLYPLNTLHAVICLDTKFSKFLQIATAISRITEPIPGIFVTYLNAFFMVIPNILMKFNNFEVVWQFCDIFDLSSAHACRVVSVNKPMLYKLQWMFCTNLRAVIASRPLLKPAKLTLQDQNQTWTIIQQPRRHFQPQNHRQHREKGCIFVAVLSAVNEDL